MRMFRPLHHLEVHCTTCWRTLPFLAVDRPRYIPGLLVLPRGTEAPELRRLPSHFFASSLQRLGWE